jgi:hypothetical protein
MMMRHLNRWAGWLLAMPLSLPILFLAGHAQADPVEIAVTRGGTAEGICVCPMTDMSRGWMTAGMILSTLLMLAVISVLFALAIFLLRRSGARARPSV